MRRWCLLWVVLFGCPEAADDGGSQPAKDAEPQLDATGGQDAGPTTDTGPAEDSGLPYYTWWQDVQPIVADKCQRCHADPPQFGAPRSFVSYDDTQVLIGASPAHEVMAFKIIADQNRMPPNGQPQLTMEEIRILRTWSTIGAPEGTPPTDGGIPDAAADAGSDGGMDDAAVDGGVPDTGTPDTGVGMRPISRELEVVAHAPGSTNPYELPVDDTTYTCWTFDVPQLPTTEHVFRFEPILDNTTNTHHMLLFYDPDAGNDPNPFECNIFPLGWDLIAGWAPGRGPDELPDGVGVPVDSSGQLVLQIHYDNVTTPGVTDQSGIRVVMTDAPNQTPAGIFWAGVIWFGQPINGSNVSLTHTCTMQDPVTIFSVFPHMHNFGKRINMEVQRQGAGPWTTLLDVTGWSFEDQPIIPIDPTEQQIMPGDRIRSSCWWDTLGQDVDFGDTTQDEMCFNFTYHYPKLSTNYVCVGGPD